MQSIEWKPITTYKEHKEKPYEQIQGLGRALAYGGLDYIFNLLKNEDSIIGIEAYVNEREKENERLTAENKRLNNIINEFEKYLEETKGIYEEYTCAIKKLKELKGVDKE